MFEISLVYPMLALVLLTFGVGVTLFRARVRAVREGLTPASYFWVYQGSPEPESIAKPSRHFINLFEAPTLFYAGCLAAMISGVTGLTVVLLAWGYVAARLAHAFIHLGSNRLRHRIPAYFAGWLFLLAIWIYVAVAVALRH